MADVQINGKAKEEEDEHRKEDEHEKRDFVSENVKVLFIDDGRDSS
jgi:hypothetical protein